MLKINHVLFKKSGWGSNAVFKQIKKHQKMTSNIVKKRWRPHDINHESKNQVDKHFKFIQQNPWGVTKKQMTHQKSLHTTLQFAVGEFGTDFIVERTDFRDSKQLVVCMNSERAAKVCNENREKIRVCLQDSMGHSGFVNPPRKIFFTHYALAHSEMEKRLEQLELEVRAEYNSKMFDDFDGKSETAKKRDVNHRSMVDKWQNTSKSPLYPLTGINHSLIIKKTLSAYWKV